MTFFTKVQDVFSVSGRGAVLVLPAEWGTDLRIRVGDKIQLRTPGGRIFDTQINGIEFVKRAIGRCVLAIMLPREISPTDIHEQTEIWLSER
jgi:hypothetical protein